jgi:ubiquinone/menaquinone biosynthesis C-methylase UbiE
MINLTLDYFSDNKIVDYYSKAIECVGLWNSEKQLIKKYSNKNSYILDVGCGAGRVSFGLYKEGYRNLYGIDLSQEMINKANNINNNNKLNIQFSCQDASDLNFNDNFFDLIIFSFNGFCTIPTREIRYQVCNEINRVLKSNGIFIFLADNQRNQSKYKWYWKNELLKWAKNNQDKRIYDFGDLIFIDDNIECFFHFYGKDELIEMLNKSGFELINNISINKFKESESVKEFCPYGVFWITKKYI